VLTHTLFCLAKLQYSDIANPTAVSYRHPVVAGEPLPQGDLNVGRLAQALTLLSAPARAAITAAHREAYRYGSELLGSAHLLLGLITDGGTAMTVALRGHGIGPDAIRSHFEHVCGARPLPQPRIVHLPYSVHAKAVVIAAADRAHRTSAPVAPAHLWSALTAATGSVAARLLTDLGQLDQIRDAALAALTSAAGDELV
jgi:ATP-dependent Clp protease ATP-binding subunit ClpA